MKVFKNILLLFVIILPTIAQADTAQITDSSQLPNNFGGVYQLVSESCKTTWMMLYKGDQVAIEAIRDRIEFTPVSGYQAQQLAGWMRDKSLLPGYIPFNFQFRSIERDEGGETSASVKINKDQVLFDVKWTSDFGSFSDQLYITKAKATLHHKFISSFYPENEHHKVTCKFVAAKVK